MTELTRREFLQMKRHQRIYKPNCERCRKEIVDAKISTRRFCRTCKDEIQKEAIRKRKQRKTNENKSDRTVL
jgi:ribosomal protein L37AE/L43A